MNISFNGVEGEQNKSICQGSSVSYTINYQALGGFSGTTTFSASEILQEPLFLFLQLPFQQMEMLL